MKKEIKILVDFLEKKHEACGTILEISKDLEPEKQGELTPFYRWCPKCKVNVKNEI